MSKIPKPWRPLLNEFIDAERRAKQSYDQLTLNARIKQSKEYQRAICVALNDGVFRSPSEMGKVKDRIFKEFCKTALAKAEKSATGKADKAEKGD